MTYNRKFWVPIILSIPVTLLSLFITYTAADFGYGSFLPAKILFPYTMLSVLINGEISGLFTLLMFLQFICYGVIIGVSRVKGYRRPVVVLLLAHLAATVIAILFVRYGGETMNFM
jgi:hypothetical protein